MAKKGETLDRDHTENAALGLDKDLIGLEKDIEQGLQNRYTTLRFPTRLEHVFNKRRIDLIYNRYLIVGISAFILYNLFLITDHQVLPDIFDIALKIRIFIVSPMILTIIYLFYKKRLGRCVDLMYSFVSLLVAGSLILFFSISNSPNVIHYHTGLVIIVIFITILLKLKFIYSFCICWLIFLLYVVCLSLFTPMEAPIVVNSSLVLFSATLVSLIGNFKLEKEFRREFLLSTQLTIYAAKLEQRNIQFQSEIRIRKGAEAKKEILISNLQKTLHEVKTLKGLLPICAHCKKIRDDKGYWNQIDSYIERHSEAEFSHGMCPECSEQFYGEQDWYIKMKKK